MALHITRREVYIGSQQMAKKKITAYTGAAFSCPVQSSYLQDLEAKLISFQRCGMQLKANIRVGNSSRVTLKVMCSLHRPSSNRRMPKVPNSTYMVINRKKLVVQQKP